MARLRANRSRALVTYGGTILQRLKHSRHRFARPGGTRAVSADGTVDKKDPEDQGTSVARSEI